MGPHRDLVGLEADPLDPESLHLPASASPKAAAYVTRSRSGTSWRDCSVYRPSVKNTDVSRVTRA